MPGPRRPTIPEQSRPTPPIPATLENESLVRAGVRKKNSTQCRALRMIVGMCSGQFAPSQSTRAVPVPTADSSQPPMRIRYCSPDVTGVTSVEVYPEHADESPLQAICGMSWSGTGAPGRDDLQEVVDRVRVVPAGDDHEQIVDVDFAVVVGVARAGGRAALVDDEVELGNHVA